VTRYIATNHYLKLNSNSNIKDHKNNNLEVKKRFFLNSFGKKGNHIFLGIWFGKLVLSGVPNWQMALGKIAALNITKLYFSLFFSSLSLPPLKNCY